MTLAHAMRMSVTAEGVETEQQADILGQLGCNILQGFLFSGAVNRNAILEIFAQPENLPMVHTRHRLPDANQALGDIRLAAS